MLNAVKPITSLSNSAKLHAVRAAVMASFGALVLLSTPSPASLLIYSECRVRAIYETALCLEEMAAMTPPINPS